MEMACLRRAKRIAIAQMVRVCLREKERERRKQTYQRIVHLKFTKVIEYEQRLVSELSNPATVQRKARSETIVHWKGFT